MKHVIIGTAGHIDHGKTSFIKALTGINTDRLKEEQKRGISIELGFSYFDLPSGIRAGIIDVPGHEKFIKNMLAGVIGIDIILLVVAADEGIMPQTLEHLAILNLLGVKKGFILITKSDLVEDEEWIELVKEEIKEEVKSTFLENSPMITVSSKTGEGVDKAIELIDEITSSLDKRNVTNMASLPVDRVFTLSGFGTIVTGTLLAGSLKIGEEVQIFPGEKKGRVRSIQVHDSDKEVAYAGQRVAINLAGLSRDDINRGDVVAPVNSMIETRILDIKVKLLKSLDREIENRIRLKLYIGTKEVLCRLVLLDRDVLKPGEEAYAQLRLEEEIVAKRGDKFILRFYSPMFTIGGGKILDIAPTRKKRFDRHVLEEMEIMEYGNENQILEKMIKDRSEKFPNIKELALSMSMLEKEVEKEINALVIEEKVVVFTLTKEIYPIHMDYLNYLEEEIINELKIYHNKYPLRIGLGKEEIRSKYIKNANSRLGDSLIDMLIKRAHIEQVNENIRLKGFAIKYNEKQEEIKNDTINILRKSEFQPPKKVEIMESIGADKEEFDEILNLLINNGEIIRLGEDVLLLKELYDKSLDRLKKYILDKGSISIGEYRDLLNSNRKVTLTILENFDYLKITKRVEEKRVLNN